MLFCSTLNLMILGGFIQELIYVSKSEAVSAFQAHLTDLTKHHDYSWKIGKENLQKRF